MEADCCPPATVYIPRVLPPSLTAASFQSNDSRATQQLPRVKRDASQESSSNSKQTKATAAAAVAAAVAPPPLLPPPQRLHHPRQRYSEANRHGSLTEASVHNRLTDNADYSTCIVSPINSLSISRTDSLLSRCNDYVSSTNTITSTSTSSSSSSSSNHRVRRHPPVKHRSSVSFSDSEASSTSLLGYSNPRSRTSVSSSGVTHFIPTHLGPVSRRQMMIISIRQSVINAILNRLESNHGLEGMTLVASGGRDGVNGSDFLVLQQLVSAEFITSTRSGVQIPLQHCTGQAAEFILRDAHQLSSTVQAYLVSFSRACTLIVADHSSTRNYTSLQQAISLTPATSTIRFNNMSTFARSLHSSMRLRRHQSENSHIQASGYFSVDSFGDGSLHLPNTWHPSRNESIGIWVLGPQSAQHSEVASVVAKLLPVGDRVDGWTDSGQEFTLVLIVPKWSSDESRISAVSYRCYSGRSSIDIVASPAVSATSTVTAPQISIVTFTREHNTQLVSSTPDSQHSHLQPMPQICALTPWQNFSGQRLEQWLEGINTETESLHQSMAISPVNVTSSKQKDEDRAMMSQILEQQTQIVQLLSKQMDVFKQNVALTSTVEPSPIAQHSQQQKQPSILRRPASDTNLTAPRQSTGNFLDDLTPQTRRHLDHIRSKRTLPF
ncbi:hypothetical protein GQ42DRAFT_70656 [Ramicandelaber brevisporus]|nr:hypothetical protein GQ42DRAFT_70656 [Ramicandelaber brevisporus]